MRRSPAFTPYVIAALVIAAMSGCLPSDPAPVPPVEPTGAPLFASDEEALAAAEEAYARYLAVSDQILSEGGVDPDRIDDYVSAGLAEIEKAGFAELRAGSLRAVGNTAFFGTVLQRYDEESSDGLEVVTVYLCSDVSGVDVLDATGSSVVSPNRPSLTPFEVAFDLAPAGQVGLVVSRQEVWSESGVCE